MISSMIAWFIANYIQAISIYIGGGAGYAVLKWIIQLLRLRSRVLDIKISDRKPESYPGYTDEQYIEYRRGLAASDIFNSSDYPPKVSKNKAMLFAWAIFWPFNLVYTLFADVAREIWNFLYRKFGAVLDSISRMILPK